MGTGDLEPWIVESDKVAVRGAPSINGKLISLLKRGDQFNVAELISIKNEDWVRLPAGTAVVKDQAVELDEENTLEMKEDAYILIHHPKFGALVKKKDGVTVQEEKQEGFLSKEVMQRILAKSSNSKELIIPLEAKTWSEPEFDLFVMSGGAVRPKWCSVPDTNEMVNNNMKDDEVETSLRQAAEMIAGADAVLIGSGAGMGVDSGLSTFRGGKAGVWPALEIVGLAYEEICDPKWFKKEPALAWAFWNFCHEAYQATKPHKGYELVRTWASKAPLGAFSFTSNIDSHWAASGWWKRRIIEVHGAVAWHQCAQGCCPDVWEAPTDLGLRESPATHRVEGELPKCPKCGKVARPCVQMFGGDSGFAKSRRAVQINRYDAWLKKMEARPDAQQLRLVCLELGCGLTVPTVRRELEAVLGRFKSARLVRVNPENPGLSKELQDKGLSLHLAAGTALASLEPQVAALAEAEKEMANFVFWDTQGGGLEFTAPLATPLMRLLRLAEAEDGVEVEFSSKNVGFTVNNLVQLHISQDLGPQERVPKSFFWSLHKRSGEKAGDGAADAGQDAVPDGEPLKTAVITCRGLTFKNGMNQRLTAKITEVGQMLDNMNEAFQTEAYQEEVRTKQDRRGVLQQVRSVHLQVLPKFGIQANDAGVWLMQVLTGLGMAGRTDIAGKAGMTMELSGINAASQLPAVLKPKEPEKPPPPPPEPLEVTLIQLTEDNPATLKFEAMTDTTVAELREKLGARLALKEGRLKQVKFLMKANAGTGGSYATMKEHESVRREIFVVGLDRWVHPEEEPPFETEVVVKNAMEDDDEVKMSAMSNMTLLQVRETLLNHLGKVDLAKKTKFVRKIGNGFAGLEDTERLGNRKVLVMMGLEEQRLKAAKAPGSEASPAPAPAGGGSAASKAPPKPRGDEPPDLTFEEALALQGDLIDGFGAESFQQKLGDINRALARGQLNERKATMERNKLYLTVQKEVLPRHGFHGSQKGVFDMMTVFGSKGFDQFEEFRKKGWILTQLLMGPEVNLPQQQTEAPPLRQPPSSSSSSSAPPRSTRPSQMVVYATSSDQPDVIIPIECLSTDTIYHLKLKLLSHKIYNAHYYVYLKKLEGGYFKEMEDADTVEEVVWAHDPENEYLKGFLPEGQLQRPPGGTPSRPLPHPGGTGRWPAHSHMFTFITANNLGDGALSGWMTDSFKSMQPKEAKVWMQIDEDTRWNHVQWMLTTPFFTRCRLEPNFSASVFTLPGFKAPWRYAMEDPLLSTVREVSFMSRWFAADGSGRGTAPQEERMLVSVVRLGEDDLVRWDAIFVKSATVADLRRRIVEVYDLDAKAGKQLRFAMERGKSYVSMVDSEKIKRAMAVRGLEGEWPPPADPEASGMTMA